MLCLILSCMSFYGCFDEQGKDRVKPVEVTIYPETWQSEILFGDTWHDVLVCSDSDDRQKRVLSEIIEGYDFDYEKGYEYSFKANKVWMNNPPMDGSNVKYEFAGSLSKKRVILENSEEEIELLVLSELVKYCPGYPAEYENERPKLYDALLCMDTNSQRTYVLKEIEGFQHESGHEYILSVKKMILAQPYSERYVLLDIKDKQEKTSERFRRNDGV